MLQLCRKKCNQQWRRESNSYHRNKRFETVKIHHFKKPSWALRACFIHGNNLALIVVDKLMVQKFPGQFGVNGSKWSIPQRVWTGWTLPFHLNSSQNSRDFHSNGKRSRATFSVMFRLMFPGQKWNEPKGLVPLTLQPGIFQKLCADCKQPPPPCYKWTKKKQLTVVVWTRNAIKLKSIYNA